MLGRNCRDVVRLRQAALNITQGDWRSTHFRGSRDRSDDLILLGCVLLDRHVIRQLGHSFLSQEARQEDVCVRQIQLAYSRIRKAKFDLKADTLALARAGQQTSLGNRIPGSRESQSIHSCLQARWIAYCRSRRSSQWVENPILGRNFSRGAHR